MKKCTMIGVLGLTALTLALAGCSASSNPRSPTDPPTASASTPSFTDLAGVNACDDDEATLFTDQSQPEAEKKKPLTLPKGCKTVFVVTSDRTIELGPTGRIVFEGTNNTVTYAGDAPVVEGNTDGNTVSPK